MPSDEELRKVAEDVRALARSLARDLWDATQSARGTGRPPGDAFKHGLRDAVKGAQREFHRGMRHHWYGWGPPPPGRGARPGGPPGPGQSGPGLVGEPPGRRPGGPNRPGPCGWGGGPPLWAPWTGAPRAHRSRGPMPPVRRRWDASILAALLVVVFGATWLIGGLGLVHLSTEAVLAAGLMLLGAALIVTARTDWSLSRHAWPVALGAVLVVGLFATSSTFGVTGALSHLSVGSMHGSATSDKTVYGGVGELTVDARNARPGAVVNVQSVVGETFVEVPLNADLTVQAKVLAGQVCIDGHSYSSGIGASTGSVHIGPGGGLALTVNAHQVAGVIEIGTKGCGH